MGWYSAVGRPLFFALPPETAHRLAGTMLGLPLPWARIGHAVRRSRAGHDRRRAPAPQPDRARRRLRQDVRAPRAALAALGFGYVVGGTITREPRAGNAKPRIVRYPARASMANAMGLPNPGARRAAASLARRDRSAGVRVRQRRRRGDRGRARGVRPAGAARRRRRAERELPQRLVGPRPRQRGASARTRDRDARPFREAVVREAPAVHDRRRARRGPGARRGRAGGRRVRSHVLEHPARA